MEFKELRKATGMTQRKYSEYFGIPLRTIEDWERGITKCNPYLLELMLYKLEKENMLKAETENKG